MKRRRPIHPIVYLLILIGALSLWFGRDTILGLFARDPAPTEGLCYTRYQNGWSVTADESFDGESLTIPASYEGKPVLSMKDFCAPPDLRSLTVLLEDTRTLRKGDLGELGSITELIIRAETGCTIHFKADALDSCPSLETLNVSGGNLHFEADSFPNTSSFRNLTLSEGSFALKAGCMEKEQEFKTLTLDRATLEIDANSGFYHATVKEMRVRGTSVELSQYRLTEFYPTISVDSLYLGAGGYVSAATEQAYPVRRLILEEDFSFENGGVSMTLYHGLLNSKTRTAPLASEIHIPVGVTSIPADFFGDEDTCAVYYEGFASDFDQVFVEQTGNAALFEGLVRIYGLEQSMLTVTFHAQGGSEVEETGVLYGHTIPRPADPVREGYAFLGWFTADGEEMGRMWSFETDTVTSATELYAHWEDLSAYGECEVLGSHEFSPISESDQPAYFMTVEKTIQSKDISRSFTVSDYATVSVRNEAGNELNPASLPLEAGENRFVMTVTSGNGQHQKTYNLVIMRLYACTVTFDDGVQRISVEADVNSMLDTPETLRAGYELQGWFRKDGTAWNFATHTVTADLTLTARWTAKTYEITLRDQGNVTLTYGEYFTLPLPTRAGSQFNGWRIENSVFVTDESGSSLVPWNIDRSITLVPDYTVHTYRITYENLMGGSNPNPALFGADQAFIPEAPAADGYEFLGWTQNGETVRQIPAGQVEDVTLTANWAPITYTITYEDPTGQTVTPPATYTVEDTVTLPSLTLEGYTFSGWRMGDRTVTAIYPGTTGDLTLYADWEGDRYSIVYEGVENAIHDNPAVYEYGAGCGLRDAERAGYDFLGWYLNGQLVTEIPAHSQKDLIVTARWKIKTYTVTFEDINGHTLHVETVDYANAVKNPPTPPTVYHKEFVRWSADVNYVTQDVTVSPVYRDHTYTVFFDMDGGAAIPSQTVYYGMPPVKPDTPVGDVPFENWYLADGTPYDFTYALNGDAVIYAAWRDYTPIYTAADFAAMEGSNGKFRLMNHINFYNEVFPTIQSFAGRFDGGGYTLSAFTLNGTGDVAMILENTGTIRNLTVKNASVQVTLPADGLQLALLVARNNGTVENCHLIDCSFGMVKTDKAVCQSSGMLTASNSGTIRGCTVKDSKAILNWTYNTRKTHSVTGGETPFGSIAGRSSGSIDACACEITVAFTSSYAESAPYSGDEQSSYMFIGAITGQLTGGSMEQCTAKMTFEGQAWGENGKTDIRIGGLIGEAKAGQAANCVADLDVTLTQHTSRTTVYVGGAVGVIGQGVEVKNCAAYGAMRRNNMEWETYYMGGFTAHNSGYIRNSYALTALNTHQDSHAAGFCAVNTSTATIRSCLTAGYLYAREGCTPEAFADENGGSILSCYYDAAMTVIGHNEQVIKAIDGAAKPMAFHQLTSRGFLTDTLAWNPAFWDCESGRWPTPSEIALPSVVIATTNRYEYGSVICSDSYPSAGETITLTAVPVETVCFVGWFRKGSDQLLSADETYLHTVRGGLELIEARFRQEDLYVYDYDDLIEMERYNLAGTTVYLMNPINCMGKQLPMIENFYGTLEGNGHAIYNFANTVTDSGEFALIRNHHGTIRNLTMSGSVAASSVGGTSRISFFTVYNRESGVIENCRAVGALKVTGEQAKHNAKGSITFYGGSFAAENMGTIRDCSTSVTDASEELSPRMTFDAHVTSRLTITGSGSIRVEATLYGGFIAGTNTGRILNCDNDGALFGRNDMPSQFESNVMLYRTALLANEATGISTMNVFVGGIVGTNEMGGRVSGCTDRSAMYINDLAGTDLWGETGAHFEGIHNAYFYSDVNFGGIAGQNNGELDHSLSEGMITYSSDHINRMGASTSGLMDGLVSTVGGISGKNTGMVSNSSHRGILIVTSAQTTHVGGMSGANSGTVANGYGGGLVMAEAIRDDHPVYLSLKFWTGFGGSRRRQGSVSVGGMVGQNTTGATVSNCLANYRFNEMNNCEEMSDYERLIKLLLIPVHIQDAFKSAFEAPPRYTHVMQVGTIAGNGQNTGNIQNCYYVENGSYSYSEGERLTANLSDLTADLIRQKLNWSITDDATLAGSFDWVVIADHYVAPDSSGQGSGILIPTISLIPGNP